MCARLWTPAELEALAASYEEKRAEEILKWAVENFGRDELALACSFAECVLVDMLLKIKPDSRVFFIDTGCLFKETLDVVEEVERKYGIKVERRMPDISVSEMEERYGRELWRSNPDLCCELRKVVPLKKTLSGLKCWITGLRREDSPSRANTPVIGWDVKYGLVKVNPIARWTKKQVWDYVTANGVPYNKLLDQGYPSIGCAPCTRPVAPGEDERAGRWAGHAKTECGLHK